MKITIVCGSPKKRFSTSMYFSMILKFFLIGNQVNIIQLKSVREYNKLISTLQETEVLVFAFPVYVDAIPSTMLEYLHKLQLDISKNSYHMKVYGLTNCGFYEGKQCCLTLDMLKNWCARTKVQWCGGIGIGAGEMLSILRLNVLIGIIPLLLKALIEAFFRILQDEYVFSYEELFTLFSSSIIGSSISYAIFSLGMFVGLYRIKSHIVNNKTHSNIFTTVWFCPRFLFVWFATIYWIIRALVCHRVPVWSLFNKIDLEKIRCNPME